MRKSNKHSTNEQQAPPGARRQLPSRALNLVFETTLLALAAFVVFAAIGPVTGRWHYEVIESGSMTPALRVGGVAVVVPEPVDKVKVGQVIAFHPPGMDNYVRIHRVIALTHRGDQVWVTTKGDANPIADPGPVRLRGKTAYTETAFVPYVGYAGVWLYKKSTRTVLTIAFFVLMVAGGLWLIWGGKQDEEEEPSVAEEVAGVHGKGGRLAGAHIQAEKAATAGLLALNNIYTAEPEGTGEAGEASTPAPAQRASVGR